MRRTTGVILCGVLYIDYIHSLCIFFQRLKVGLFSVCPHFTERSANFPKSQSQSQMEQSHTDCISLSSSKDHWMFRPAFCYIMRSATLGRALGPIRVAEVPLRQDLETSFATFDQWQQSEPSGQYLV